MDYEGATIATIFTVFVFTFLGSFATKLFPVLTRCVHNVQSGQSLYDERAIMAIALLAIIVLLTLIFVLVVVPILVDTFID